MTATRTDGLRDRIAAHAFPRGGVEVVRANRGSRCTAGARTAPLPPAANRRGRQGPGNVVARTASAAPGEFGPPIMPLNQALEFIATKGFFWINA